MSLRHRHKNRQVEKDKVWDKLKHDGTNFFWNPDLIIKGAIRNTSKRTYQVETDT